MGIIETPCQFSVDKAPLGSIKFKKMLLLKIFLVRKKVY